MCAGAIMLAGIRRVVFACSAKEFHKLAHRSTYSWLTKSSNHPSKFHSSSTSLDFCWNLRQSWLQNWK